jgi:hypothetical protein
LWTRYFLEAQGYGADESIVYQDNQSAMLLEKNGRGSSSKRTRHINIRYFFVADRIASREVKVEYCPTGDMVADYFTKPLQGTLFRKFRDIIMNGDPALSTPLADRRSVLKCETGPTSVIGPADGGRQTGQTWTVVGHRRDMNKRHRILRKRINEKRNG